jgi:hypothetical protein
MSAMEPSTASQPPAADRSEIGQHRPQGDADTSQRVRPPQIRSLRVPGVASSPVLPEWLRAYFRNRFRRKDTPAAR